MELPPEAEAVGDTSLAAAAVQTDVQELQLALSQCLSTGQHCQMELFSHVSCQQESKKLIKENSP